MSTPDQPDTPPLTRRQLREIRNTGATPIITPEEAADAGADDAASVEETPSGDVSAVEAPEEEAAAPVAPLPRAAEEPALAPAPTPDAHVDLGVSPLTRRQAREQERIRTASVPVITPDHAPVHAAEDTASPEPSDDVDVVVDAPAEDAPEPEAAADESAADEDAVLAADEDLSPVDEESATPAGDASADDEPLLATTVDDAPADSTDQGEDVVEATIDADVVEASDEVGGLSAEEGEPAADDSAPPATEEDAHAGESAATDAGPDLDASFTVPDSGAPVAVDPDFGRDLLAGRPQVVNLPPSFDQLITRSSSASGSSATPNALILSQTPSAAPLVGPVTSTGEVLVTGSFDLPAGIGSIGHAHGAADGKDIDVSLIDGELPPASSPTPIAASAAISTVKSADEIIRPPAPEKGSRLAVILGIVAGALALGLIGVLIVALTTGVWT